MDLQEKSLLSIKGCFFFYYIFFCSYFYFFSSLKFAFWAFHIALAILLLVLKVDENSMNNRHTGNWFCYKNQYSNIDNNLKK